MTTDPTIMSYALEAGKYFPLVVAFAAVGYQAFALWCVARFNKRRPSQTSNEPPVTVIKPVFGLDTELFENLQSFCRQDYGPYQVIFTAAHQEDPAIPVVQRVMTENPHLDLSLVVNARRSGTNQKMSNVANAYEIAKHDLVVIADSDMRVGKDYLRCIAKAFEPPEVGAVTCPYTGSTSGNLASKLACLYINESFLPSVLVATVMEPLTFCFGATMAVRRDALNAIGGFRELSAYLADDYMLGNLVSQKGYRVALAPYVVTNIVQEAGLAALLRHELRWARTVRTSRPGGYAMSILTHSVFLTSLSFFAFDTGTLGLLALTLACGLRAALHYAAEGRFGITPPISPWLLPLRDLLNIGVWIASYLGNRVEWRGGNFTVRRDGTMINEELTP
jgi:ceramide glucosyltransferase